jgi:hypothetical protein
VHGNIFCIQSGHIISENLSVTVGVEQGDDIIPNLSKIYNNDLPDIFNLFTTIGTALSVPVIFGVFAIWTALAVSIIIIVIIIN